MQRVHIQAAVTEERHKRLYDWWTSTEGDKSATVRIALDWFLFEFRPQMNRIESLLEAIVEYQDRA